MAHPDTQHHIVIETFNRDRIAVLRGVEKRKDPQLLEEARALVAQFKPAPERSPAENLRAMFALNHLVNAVGGPEHELNAETFQLDALPVIDLENTSEGVTLCPFIIQNEMKQELNDLRSRGAVETKAPTKEGPVTDPNTGAT